MATTSIWSIRNRLDHVLDYVGNSKKTSYENDDLLNVLHYAEDDFKTEEKKLVSGINCDATTAHKEMTMTKKRFNKLDGVISLHGYQSFNEGEVTPELAHEIGVKLANEMWGDRFEVIVATHINTKHIHNHIVVNSVSFVDGMKAYNNRAEYSRMRHLSDEICNEYGLSVLEEKPCGKYNIDYSKVYESDIVHSNQKTKAKAVIDYAISKAKKYSDFIGILNELGYFVTQRTKDSLSIRDVAHYNRNIRVARALGENYTIERIKERIYASNKELELDRLLKFNKIYYKRIYTGVPIDKVKLRLSPLYRKYIKYMFGIKQYPRNFYFKEMTPQMYLDRKDFSELAKQLDYIAKHKIKTFSDVTAMYQEYTSKLNELKMKRLSINTRLSTSFEKDELLEEKNNLTSEINSIKQEVVMLKNIINRRARLKAEMNERIIDKNYRAIEDKYNNKEVKRNERV